MTRCIVHLTLAVVALGLASAASSTAHATVLKAVSIDEMTASATAVVEADVIETGVRVSVEGDQAIPYTVTRFRVRRWLKGRGNDEVTLVEYGGVWKGGGTVVAGTPQYSPGDRVVVFLERDPKGQLRTYGMVQGRFLVEESDQGPVCHRDLRDVGLARWNGGPMRVTHGREEAAVPLSWLIDRVRALVEAGR
jgi:hypothetical protein